jgi:hypothetical protein
MSFQNIRKIIALISLCIGLSIATRAQACPVRTYEAPAKASKIYRNVNVGFSFAIPANYKVMASQDGASILDPSTYSYVQCILRNKIRTEFPQESFSVSFMPIRSKKGSLRNMVMQKMPWIEQEGFDFNSATILGKPALVFSQMNNVDDIKLNYTSFFSPNRRYLIIIYGPEQGQELKQALSTLQLK